MTALKITLALCALFTLGLAYSLEEHKNSQFYRAAFLENRDVHSERNMELYEELCQYQIPGKNVQNTENCAQFIVCLGNYWVMDCPSGLYFDNQSQKCEWKQTVQCPDYLTAK